ncbi:MAG: hypothetical protein HY875_02810 [Chloroflexi bacterium]|nr:hypothetical protein [Chloroflexota bacterium]
MGAPQAAIDYYRFTGNFLWKYWHFGTVDVGVEATNPADAGPGLLVLLNGAPLRVVPTPCWGCLQGLQTASTDGEVKSQHNLLTAAFPKVFTDRCGGPSEVLESAASSATGQEFVFQHGLWGPYAACGGAPGYVLRFRVSFGSDGTVIGFPDVVGFCKSTAYPLPTADLLLPACPARYPLP